MHNVELEAGDGGARGAEGHQLRQAEAVGAGIARLRRKPRQSCHGKAQARSLFGHPSALAMGENMDGMSGLLQRPRHNQRGCRAAAEAVGDIGKADAIEPAHRATP